MSASRHSGESRTRSEALALSSKFNAFWMPPYQVRGRLIKSGMTISRLFTSLSNITDVLILNILLILSKKSV